MRRTHASLGYKRQPFPAQGEVSELYEPRRELEPLRADLLAFLNGRDQGHVWALAGVQGVGKSNFLRMVRRELEEARASNDLTETGFHLFEGNAWSPAALVGGIMLAIGTSPIEQLVGKRPPAPAAYEGTDFGRYWQAVRGTKPPTEVAAEFLFRWLSGQPTTARERVAFDIHARERLAPALGIPYLRELLLMLEAAGIMSRLVLLFDELETVQSLTPSKRSEYVQLLKTLLNAFNWRGLYVMLAGAPAALREIAQVYPSLGGRWQLVELQPLTSAADAVQLVERHKRAAALDPKTIAQMFPVDVDVKSLWIELQQSSGQVRQRSLLDRLRQDLEARLAELPRSSRPRR